MGKRPLRQGKPLDVEGLKQDLDRQAADSPLRVRSAMSYASTPLATAHALKVMQVQPAANGIVQNAALMAVRLFRHEVADAPDWVDVASHYVQIIPTLKQLLLSRSLSDDPRTNQALRVAIIIFVATCLHLRCHVPPYLEQFAKDAHPAAWAEAESLAAVYKAARF